MLRYLVGGDSGGNRFAGNRFAGRSSGDSFRKSFAGGFGCTHRFCSSGSTRMFVPRSCLTRSAPHGDCPQDDRFSEIGGPARGVGPPRLDLPPTFRTVLRCLRAVPIERVWMDYSRLASDVTIDHRIDRYISTDAQLAPSYRPRYPIPISPTTNNHKEHPE